MFNLSLPWIIIFICLAYLLYIKISSLKFWFILRVVSHMTSNSFIQKPQPKLNVKTIMSIIISHIVLGCSLYIILSGGYPEAEQKWAFSTVGTIIEYWFK